MGTLGQWGDLGVSRGTQETGSGSQPIGGLDPTHSGPPVDPSTKASGSCHSRSPEGSCRVSQPRPFGHLWASASLLRAQEWC